MRNEITIRNSKEIKRELDAARTDATAYNALYNEGGEGYDGGRREKVETLKREHEIAKEYESFLALFSDAVAYQAKKAAWNAEVSKRAHGGKISREDMRAIESTVGVTIAQMARAKKMYA